MKTVIIGGGIIGLSIGWQLARSKCPVAIYEAKRVGKGASFAAAGMLSPFIEAKSEETALLQTGIESLKLFPQFLKELEEDSGLCIPLHKSGTLYVASRVEDISFLPHLYRIKKEQGIDALLLDRDQTLEKEPFLSTKVTSSLWLPEDASINNRKMLV